MELPLIPGFGKKLPDTSVPADASLYVVVFCEWGDRLTLHLRSPFVPAFIQI